MRWNRYRLKTRTDAAEVVIATLAGAGVEGVEVEDNVPLTEEEKKQMFVDIMPPTKEDDGIAWLSFYVDSDEDDGTLLKKVREELEDLRLFMDIGEGTIEKSQTEDVDWINNWKQYFHQFYVDDILITPSWEEVKEEDRGRMIIHIDPGTAFGTGMHETTQLCIRALKQKITPETTMLDVGTGSGILSIAALKLGAKYCAGTDLDPCAVSAVEENLAANGIAPERMTMILGNVIEDPDIIKEAQEQRYDIVVANILAPVLIALTPVVPQFLKDGGTYILSGIIEDKEEDVKEALLRGGFSIEEVSRQGEWVAITARKGN